MSEQQKEIEEKVPKQKVKEEVYLEKYLSSNNLDVFSIKGKKENEQQPTIFEKIKTSLIFIISILINCLVFTILPFLLMLLPFVGIIISIVEKKITYGILLIWILICNSSVIYSLLIFIFYPAENKTINYFELDGIFFFFVTILVFSYLKTVYLFQRKTIKEMILDYEGTFSTFQYFHQEVDDSSAFFLDYDQSEFKLQDIEEIMIDQGYSKYSFSFSSFLSNIDLNGRETQPIFVFINEFKLYFFPSFKSFFFLSAIVLIKLGFCFHYISLQVSDMSNKQYFEMIVSIFLYIYVTFNLNRILGNNDLRRKHAFMVKQSQYIDFKNIQEINLKQKIDVVCPISLESWDNARKFILAFQNDWLETIELSYFCLFLYLIIAILICLSSYFEFNWIFEKNSVLLNPIVVIMNSFNCIFLGSFFLIRFYEGNKFNDTFEDLDNSLIYLIDIIEDLLTMFDSHFNCEVEDIIQDQRHSIFGILVKKIKLLSKFYIENQKEYQGRKYSMQEKSKLRKKILMNAKISLEKIKKSVNNDSTLHKYKFLNIIEVNFLDILITLIFALVTTLPTIVPKFIELFTNESSQ